MAETQAGIESTGTELTQMKGRGDLSPEDRIKGLAEHYGNQFIRMISGVENAEELIREMNAFPTANRHLAKYIRNNLLADYIYVKKSNTTAFWYWWDETIWVEQGDLQFGEFIADGVEVFYNLCVSGFAKVVEKYRPDKVAAAKGVVLTEDELATNKLAARIDTAMGEILKMEEALSDHRAMQGVRGAIEAAVHRNKDYFLDDSDYIVAADGWVLLTRNLSAGWQKPSKSRHVSRKLGVAHEGSDVDPGAWSRALDVWFPGEEGKKFHKYLQVALGAALLGRGDARHIPSLFGGPKTGKSTFVKLFREMFGGYASLVSREFIAKKSGTNFQRSRAQGVRYLLLEEADKFDIADTGFMKELAGGGGTMVTEKKGMNAEEWPIQCVLFIATNHRLKVDVSDDAIVERVDYVEFKHKFVAGTTEFIKSLEKHLMRYSAHTIFQWVLEGAIIWDNPATDEFPRPQEMIEQDGISRKEGSSVLMWLDSAMDIQGVPLESGENFRLAEAPGVPAMHCVKVSEAFAAYKEWAFAEGFDKPMGRGAFISHINSEVKVKERKSGVPRLLGLRRIKAGVSEENPEMRDES